MLLPHHHHHHHYSYPLHLHLRRRPRHSTHTNNIPEMHPPIIRSRPPNHTKRRRLQPLPLQILLPEHMGIRAAPFRQLRQPQHKPFPRQPLHLKQPPQKPRLAHALVPRPQVARVQPDAQRVQVRRRQRHQRVAELLPRVVRHGERWAGPPCEGRRRAVVAAAAVAAVGVGVAGGGVVDLRDEVGEADAQLDGAEGVPGGRVRVGVAAAGVGVGVGVVVAGEEVGGGAGVGEDEGGVGVQGGEGLEVSVGVVSM